MKCSVRCKCLKTASFLWSGHKLPTLPKSSCSECEVLTKAHDLSLLNQFCQYFSLLRISKEANDPVLKNVYLEKHSPALVKVTWKCEQWPSLNSKLGCPSKQVMNCAKLFLGRSKQYMHFFPTHTCILCWAFTKVSFLIWARFFFKKGLYSFIVDNCWLGPKFET